MCTLIKHMQILGGTGRCCTRARMWLSVLETEGLFGSPTKCARCPFEDPPHPLMGTDKSEGKQASCSVLCSQKNPSHSRLA